MPSGQETECSRNSRGDWMITVRFHIHALGSDLVITIKIIIMQICSAPVSKIQSEVRVQAASRGMGERKTANSKF